MLHPKSADKHGCWTPNLDAHPSIHLASGVFLEDVQKDRNLQKRLPDEPPTSWDTLGPLSSLANPAVTTRAPEICQNEPKRRSGSPETAVLEERCGAGPGRGHGGEGRLLHEHRLLRERGLPTGNPRILHTSYQHRKLYSLLVNTSNITNKRQHFQESFTLLIPIVGTN